MKIKATKGKMPKGSTVTIVVVSLINNICSKIKAQSISVFNKYRFTDACFVLLPIFGLDPAVSIHPTVNTYRIFHLRGFGSTFSSLYKHAVFIMNH